MIASHHGIVAGPAQSHDGEPIGSSSGEHGDTKVSASAIPIGLAFWSYPKPPSQPGESVPPSTRACTATGSITRLDSRSRVERADVHDLQAMDAASSPYDQVGSRRLNRVDLPPKTGQQLEPGYFYPLTGHHDEPSTSEGDESRPQRFVSMASGAPPTTRWNQSLGESDRTPNGLCECGRCGRQRRTGRLFRCPRSTLGLGCSPTACPLEKAAQRDTTSRAPTESCS